VFYKKISALENTMNNQITDEAGKSEIKGIYAYSTEISVEQADKLLKSEENALVLDMRSETAFQLSRLKGASHIAEEGIATFILHGQLSKEAPIIIYCSVGFRSIMVAEKLRKMGYSAVSIAGGYTAWRAAGCPVESTDSFSLNQMERYSRNMYLKEIGKDGQMKLLNAKVLIVGAGGLASSAALYLAAAGIGTIGLVDFDIVDASNLNRQVVHGVADIGRLKVESAKFAINRINPDVSVIPFAERLTTENALTIVQIFDVVMDASDNFGTKFLLHEEVVYVG
jgi:sulfur-carrier protein adenylyltransferase/sulfurtransferase